MRKVHKLKELYFDDASSSPVFPEVLNTYTKLLNEHYANADALHPAGLKISKMLEDSKSSLAKQLEVDKSTLTFVSGATLANNILIKGLAYQFKDRGKHIITSSVEHASVLECFKDLEKYDAYQLTILDVNEDGQIDDDTLINALRADTILVSIMAVNNETGVILPVEHYADLVHQHSKAYFHTDAVQALSKYEIDYKKIDAASFTAHKIHGLKGSALIYLKEGILIHPILSGGHLDHGMVAGTPNALAHILFAKTLRLASDEHQKSINHVKHLNQYLRARLSELDQVVINSPENQCSPYILNFSILDLPSQVMLNILGDHHIYASAAATCSDKTFKASHVLVAMKKCGNVLKGVIRISLSSKHSIEDINRLIEVIEKGRQNYAR